MLFLFFRVQAGVFISKACRIFRNWQSNVLENNGVAIFPQQFTGPLELIMINQSYNIIMPLRLCCPDISVYSTIGPGKIAKMLRGPGGRICFGEIDDENNHESIAHIFLVL